MRFARPLVVFGTAIGLLTVGAQIQSQNRAVAQLSTASGAPVNPLDSLPAPPSELVKPLIPTASLFRTPVPAARPFSVPTPAATPVPVLKPRFPGQNVIRVGLTTAGGAVAVWVPGGATLFDLSQPGLTLSLPAGTRFQFTCGPVRVSKRGSQSFQGPISVTTPGHLSDGWSRVYVAVAGDPARVATNNSNPRYGRPYRGDLEVFPQRLAEPVKRKGPLALVNVVPLESYLKGVVPWEMSPTAPIEALKAQAICARTKTLKFVSSKTFAKGNFDICDYDACQGYPGMENEKPSTTKAVETTTGLAIYQNGHPIDAVYSTNSGGITADARDVWKSTSGASYLQSVADLPASSPFAKMWKKGMTEADWAQFCSQSCLSYARPDGVASTRYEARKYRWTQFVSSDEATKAFVSDGISRVINLQVVQRTPSGRIRILRVTGVDAAKSKFLVTPSPTPLKTPLPFGTMAPVVATPISIPLSLKTVDLEGDAKVRAMFSKRLGSTTALPSSLFVITPQVDASGVTTGWNLQGAGWGHGVGMCQRGAQNHAAEGWDFKRILNWYYHGVQIRSMR